MSILDHDNSKRAADDENPTTLLMIALAAFAVYYIATPILYQQITGRKVIVDTRATSQPATQRASSIPLRDLAALSITAPAVGLVTLVTANLFWRRRPFERMGFTPARLWRRGWLQSLVAILLTLPLMVGVLYLTEWVYQRLNYQHPTEHDLLRALLGESIAIQAVIIFAAVVLAPLFEELFFRGMVQSALRMMFPPRFAWGAVLIASVAFAMVHPAWMRPPILVLSLCLGFGYEWTRNLWVPILVHAAFNAASTTLFLLQP